MSDICTIGLDTAKHVFQVHAGREGENHPASAPAASGCRRFSPPLRLAPCTVGSEACGADHHWAREIARFGHDVRLMQPSHVKPYVKRNKNDAANAEACCEVSAGARCASSRSRPRTGRLR
jgi:transposase